MKTIELTRGHVAMVDDEDYERVLAAGQWCAKTECGKTYAQLGARQLLLGRFILGVTWQAWLRVRYINGNGLDCRRVNLRLVDSSP